MEVEIGFQVMGDIKTRVDIGIDLQATPGAEVAIIELGLLRQFESQHQRRTARGNVGGFRSIASSKNSPCLPSSAQAIGNNN